MNIESNNKYVCYNSENNNELLMKKNKNGKGGKRRRIIAKSNSTFHPNRKHNGPTEKQIKKAHDGIDEANKLLTEQYKRLNSKTYFLI